MHKVFFLLILFISTTAFTQNLSDTAFQSFDGYLIVDSAMNQGNIADPLFLIKGRAAGLTVTKGDGHPMNHESVLIRGMGSRGWDNRPLYVIDGIPGADPYGLFPGHIRSMKIHRNVASTSKYGIYGGNGVIEINTIGNFIKDTFQVLYHSMISFDQPSERLDLLTASEFRREAQRFANILEMPVEEFFDDLGASTDWQDEVFRQVVTHQQNVAVSQSINNTRYRLAFNFRDQPGLLIQSGKRKIGLNSYVNQSLFNDKLNLSIGYTLADLKYKGISESDSETVLLQAYTRIPTNPVNMPADTFSFVYPYHFYGHYDPVFLINSYHNTQKRKSQRINVALDYKLSELLTFSINSGLQKIEKDEEFFMENAVIMTTRIASFRERTDKLYFLNSQLNFEIPWSDHSIFTSNIFYSYQNSRFNKYINTYLSNLHNQRNNALSGEVNYFHKRGLKIRWISRYDNIMLHDVDEYRKHYWSHSVSLGWNLKKLVTNSLFERFSRLEFQYLYGKAFSQPLPNQTVRPLHDNFHPTSEHVFSFKTGLLKNRLTLDVNFYKRTTSNKHYLVIYTSSGPGFSPYDYIVINKGAEADLRWLVFRKEQFSWNTGFHYQLNNNRIKTLNSDYGFVYSSYGDQIFDEGQSLYTFNMSEYAYSEGIDLYYYDNEGGITTNPYDARKTRASVFPEYQVGWQNELHYHNFNLSFSMRYVHGNYIYNADRLILSELHFPDNNALSGEFYPNLTHSYHSDFFLEDASYLRIDNIVLGYTLNLDHWNMKGLVNVYFGVNNLVTLTNFSGLNPEIDYERPVNGWEAPIFYNNDMTGISAASGYPPLRSFFMGVKITI